MSALRFVEIVARSECRLHGFRVTPAARESHKAADLRVRVGPAWVSPDPATVVLPANQRVEAPAQQPAFSVPVTPRLWSGSVRCYHPEMHAAEVTVARELARLAARPLLPIRAKTDPRAKIDAWITKNEKETGERPSTHTAVSSPGSTPSMCNRPPTVREHMSAVLVLQA